MRARGGCCVVVVVVAVVVVVVVVVFVVASGAFAHARVPNAACVARACMHAHAGAEGRHTNNNEKREGGSIGAAAERPHTRLRVVREHCACVRVVR